MHACARNCGGKTSREGARVVGAQPDAVAAGLDLLERAGRNRPVLINLQSAARARADLSVSAEILKMLKFYRLQAFAARQFLHRKLMHGVQLRLGYMPGL